MLTGVLIAGGCSPLTTAGKLTGAVAGRQIAAAVGAAPAKVVPAPKGGWFCTTMAALGWPPQITDDKLNRPFENVTIGTLEHGEKYCGWRPPK